MRRDCSYIECLSAANGNKHTVENTREEEGSSDVYVHMKSVLPLSVIVGF